MSVTVSEDIILINDRIDLQTSARIVNAPAPTDPGDLVSRTYVETGTTSITTGTLITDTVSESTTGAGVTIDGVLLRDSLVSGVDLATEGIKIQNLNFPVEDVGNLDFLSQINSTGSNHRNVFVNGNYAYIADSGTGLTTYNISNPLAPIFEGSVDQGGNHLAVYVTGTTLYVTASGAGLHVYDISTPQTPSFVTTVDNGGTYDDVDGSGDLLIVTVGSTGIHVYDISTPSAPSFQSTKTEGLGATQGVHVTSSTTAYVAFNDGWFEYDATNKASLSLTKSVTNLTSATCQNVYVDTTSSILYVPYSNQGTAIYDISGAPSLLFTVDAGGSANDAFVDTTNDVLYVANGNRGIDVYDVSTLPGSIPLLTSNVDLGGSCTRVTKAGDYVYGTFGTTGLKIHTTLTTFSVTKMNVTSTDINAWTVAGTAQVTTQLLTDDIDTLASGTLLLGKDRASKVEIGDTGIETEVQGNLDVLQTATVAGDLTLSSNLIGTSSELRNFLPSVATTTTFKGMIRAVVTAPVSQGTFSTGVSIPANAYVTNGFYDVITTFTSNTDTATIGFGINTDDTNGILAPIAINDGSNPFDAGLKTVIQDNTLANFSNKTTAQRTIDIVVAIESLNIGKLVLFLEFMTSEV